jgi:hypothetical protein
MSGDPMEPSEQFAQDLGAIYHADVEIPASIDDAILNRARARLARPHGSRALILRLGALVTAAAAMILVVLYLNAPPQATTQRPQVAVDIVDALRIARDIRDGRANVSQDDFNHDGNVDQLDVDAVAIAAVRLEKVQ